MPFFNNKSDIWALGCILYELATEQKAFTGDWGVLQYVNSKLSLAMSANQYVWQIDGAERAQVEKIVHLLLEVEYAKRPSAESLMDLVSEASSRTVVQCK